MEWLPESWSSVVGPQGPLLELVVRATVIYFFLLLLMRLAGRRLFAQLAMTDILMVLLIAVAVREGLTGGHHALGDAIVVVLTLLFWNRIMDGLAFRVPALRKVLRHQPLPLVRDGRLVHENVRATQVTETELVQRVREQGLISLDQVHDVYLEQDGNMSVVPRSKAE